MRRSKAIRRARIREEMGFDQPLPNPRWYERNWFKAIELAAIIIGVCAISYEVWQRETVDRPVAEATLRELEAAERERARSVIASSTATMAEKIGALHALVSAGRSLSFLDASCPTWATVDESITCLFSPAHITGLQLAYESGVRHTDFHLENVELQVATLRNWQCDRCYMHSLIIDRGEISNVTFHNSDLRGAWLFPSSASGVLISRSNVSGLRFEAGILSSANFENAWMYDGEPPIVYESRPLVMGILAGYETPSRPLSDDEIESLGIINCGDPHQSIDDDARRAPVACLTSFIDYPVQ
jgi:hypothetical protein